MISRQKALALRRLIEKAVISLSDEDALDAVELFPAYQVGVAYKEGFRFNYNGKLYKVLQDHTSQTDWKPESTPSLYAEVEKPGEGDTPDNPIAYNGNMALINDKYYIQDGVVYRCIRDTVNPVYNALRDLVGLYVEVADA
jgi:hypothetical protein